MRVSISLRLVFFWFWSPCNKRIEKTGTVDFTWWWGEPARRHAKFLGEMIEKNRGVGMGEDMKRYLAYMMGLGVRRNSDSSISCI